MRGQIKKILSLYAKAVDAQLPPAAPGRSRRTSLYISWERTKLLIRMQLPQFNEKEKKSLPSLRALLEGGFWNWFWLLFRPPSGFDKKLILDKTGLLFSWMVNQGIIIYSYEHPKDRWWDIGTEKDLNEARDFYNNL